MNNFDIFFVIFYIILGVPAMAWVMIQSFQQTLTWGILLYSIVIGPFIGLPILLLVFLVLGIIKLFSYEFWNKPVFKKRKKYAQ